MYARPFKGARPTKLGEETSALTGNDRDMLHFSYFASPFHDNGTDLTIDLLSALPRDLPGVSAVVRNLNPRWDNHVKYTIEPASRNSLLILLVYHRLIDLRGSLLFAGLLVTAIRPGYQDFSLPLILARRTCLLRRMNASLGISVSVGSDGQVYGKTR